MLQSFIVVFFSLSLSPIIHNLIHFLNLVTDWTAGCKQYLLYWNIFLYAQFSDQNQCICANYVCQD